MTARDQNAGSRAATGHLPTSKAVGDSSVNPVTVDGRGLRGAHYAVLSMLTALVLIYGSLVPFHFRPIPVAQAAARFRSQPLFVRPRGKNRIDWCVNFLITVPLSMFALGALLAGRRRWSHLLWAIPVVLTGSIGLSLSVEFFQSWFPPRVPSLSDVVAQSVGAIAGIGLWLMAGRTIDESIQDFRRLRRPPDRIDWLLHGYVIVLLIHSVLPLNVIFSAEELLRKYRTGKIELIPFSSSYASIWWMLYERGLDLLEFVPVGMWAAVVWTPRGRSLRRLIPACLLGFSVVSGIEVVQLLIMSRFSSTTDVILGCAGVLLGWQVMRLWRKETAPLVAVETGTGPVWPWLVATGLYTLFLLFLYWAPFDFTGDVGLIKSKLNGFWVVPFARFASGSALQGLAGILRDILWFAPLGILLANAVLRATAVRSFRRVLLAFGCVMLGGVSLMIELGQVFLPGRVADITGVLLGTTAGLAALVMTVWVLRTDD